MWFKKTKPAKKMVEMAETVEARMERYKIESRTINDFNIEYNKKSLYVKVYYIEGTTQGGKNVIYADLFEKFLDNGWKFQGVRDYMDNHELCFTYTKA